MKLVSTQTIRLIKWNVVLLIFLALAMTSCGKINDTVLYKEANKLFKDEDYANAAAKYKELTNSEFFKKDAWLHLGYCYLSMVRGALNDEDMQTNKALAVEAFQKYLELDPSNQKVEDYIFNTFMDSRDYESVLRFLFDKFEKNPQDIRAIQLIIQTYEDQGKVFEAVEWYKKRCEVTPDDSDAYYAFAVFYWRNSYYNRALEESLRATFVDEGIDLIKTSTELNPEFADAYTYWNLLLREKVKYTKSKRKQEKLIEEAKLMQQKGAEVRAAQQAKEAAAEAAAEGAPGEAGMEGEAPAEGADTPEGSAEEKPAENETS